jgi:hypothetical protein
MHAEMRAEETIEAYIIEACIAEEYTARNTSSRVCRRRIEARIQRGLSHASSSRATSGYSARILAGHGPGSAKF